MMGTRTYSGMNVVKLSLCLTKYHTMKDVKLTAHRHLVPRLRMRGAIPPLLHLSIWRGT